MRRGLTLIPLVAILLTLGASAAPALSAQPPTLAGCPVFPADNAWNRRVDRLPVTRNSATLIRSIGLDAHFHADFGSGLWDGGPIGIPFTVVDGGQPRAPIRFDYADESDRGPYPVPADAPIEGGRNADGDRHVLVVDKTACRLYELYDAHPLGGGGSWHAGSGATWDLRSNRLRPKTWTSADAAGLPILPGRPLRRSGAGSDQPRAALHGATHADELHLASAASGRQLLRPLAASDGTPRAPERGVSLRGLPRQAKTIATAMKRYGLMLADNGSPWYVSGAPDPRWDNDQLHALDRLSGRDFEVVMVKPRG